MNSFQNIFNLRILSKGRVVAYIIDEIPQFKNLLIDDISQCVYRKCIDDGKPVTAIFPYENFDNLEVGK